MSTISTSGDENSPGDVRAAQFHHGGKGMAGYGQSGLARTVHALMGKGAGNRVGRVVWENLAEGRWRGRLLERVSCQKGL